MGGRLWHYAPLLLLGIAVVVWIEPWLPRPAGMPDDAFLRFAAGVVAVFGALILVQVQHLESLFKQVLQQFKQFHVQQSGEGKEHVKRDAASILVAALDSTDEKVRARAVQNLERLTGQRFGEDAAAWRAWLERAGADDA